MAQLTNVGMVWSGNVLKFVPYADAAMSGNGVTFSPNTTPIFDLTDDDFQPTGDDEGPVKVDRGSPSDSFNVVNVEFFDRANDYNIAIMPATDDADIADTGKRTMATVSAHWITDANVAKVVAQLILQRSMFVRNTYSFTLGWTKIALEPMDLVTITDPNLGLNKQPVRILTIVEDDTGLLAVTAEDFPKGSASATLYPTTSGTGYTPNYNVSPGSALAPAIFEAPSDLSTSKSNLELWLATGGVDPNYGGCEIWTSLDGSNYQRAYVLKGSSRFGVTTTAMQADAQPGLTSESVNVALQAGGQILSGSAVDRDRLTTLCYVDGEFISYDTATLTGQGAYRLGPSLVRGAYGSGQAAHAAGAKFVRCDDGVAKMTLTGDYIGQLLYVKLLAFNAYGGAMQGLGDVVGYTYTVTGAQANLSPLAPANLALEGPFTIDTCKAKWDAAARASTYNVQVWAGSPLAKRRAVNVGAALRFDYSADDARTDGGPWRALELRVQGINANGALGAFSVLDVANPQVGALTGVAVTPTASSIDFSCITPTDPDFAGVQVWLGTAQNFTPAAANLVYDGPATQVSIKRDGSNAALVVGQNYYLKWAAYDSFDRAGVTVGASDVVQLLVVRQVANVQLFQWSVAKPNVPAGVSVFDWTANANGSYNGSDGWTSLQPSNPGGSAQLWVANVNISVPGGTTSTNVSYSSANIFSLSQNGASAQGFQVAPVAVYRWDSSASAPPAPSGTATYTWANAQPISAPPSGWTLNSGAAPSPGMTLYVARMQLTDAAANATTAINWANSSVGILTTAPYAGSSSVTAYATSSYTGSTVAPAATVGIGSVPANNSGNVNPSSWSQTAPGTIPPGSFLYVCDGTYNPATNAVIWNAPYPSSAKFGSLSAVSTITGKLTVTDVISDAGGNWSVDANGLATMKSFKLVDPNTGAVMMQAGVALAAAYAPQGTLNTAISIGQNGALTGGGGGQVTIGGLGYSGALNATYGAPSGTSVGGTEAGLLATRALNGDSAYNALPGVSAAVATAGKATFATAPGCVFDFNASYGSLGWYAENGGQISYGTDWMTFASANSDPMLAHDLFSFSGATYDKVRARVRRTAGSGWDGMLVYINAHHNEDGGYTKSIPDTTVTGQWVILEWDMTTGTNPADWASGLVTHIRLDFGASAADVFDIDWIVVGRYGPTNLAGIGYTGDTNATYGANSSNLNIGLGGRNKLSNSVPNSASLFSASFYSGAVGTWGYFGPGNDPNGWSVWTPGSKGGIVMHITTLPAGGGGDLYSNDIFPVVAGQYYEVGVTLSVHRCAAWINLEWLKADGTESIEIAGNVIQDSSWNIGSGTSPPRSFVIGKAPADAVNARLFVRAGSTGESDSYVFSDQFYAGDALASQTVPSPYSPGITEARDLAVAAQAGLADKVSQTAGGVLQGQVTLQTSGAIVAGNASFSSAGYGGTGAVMSPYGFACLKNGVPTFAASVNGDVSFGGTLTGASGTFGLLRVGAGGAIASGGFDGTWNWPAAGSTPGFCIHPNGLLFGNEADPNQGFFELFAYGALRMPGFEYVGRQLTLSSTVIVSPTINSPTVSNQIIADSYTATITGSAGGSYPNGSYSYGSLTANPSGGRAPYTYSWSLTPYSKTGNAGNMTITNPQAQSVSFGGSGTNASLDYLVSCVITDANNRTTTLNAEIFANHGTPP
jgi:hypothetical protein